MAFVPEIATSSVMKQIAEYEKRNVCVYTLLKSLREERGLTQKDIAKSTGLTQQMISKIESGKGNLSVNSFIKYCNVLGIDIVTYLEGVLDERTT